MAGRRAAAPWAMPAALLLAALGSGCASHAPGPGYYWQSVTGHLRLMAAARPIDDWLADPATPAPLRPRLERVREMREFAVQELGLPDNASYHRYADLGRRAAVFNVVAAPEFSLILQTWCFPVAGCVGYRGYFSEAAARAYAQERRAAGREAASRPLASRARAVSCRPGPRSGRARRVQCRRPTC